MDAERVRAMVRKLPHVEETVQWGETLVFWVGDKAIGGKMFALVKLSGEPGRVMSLSAGGEGYAGLLEIEGVLPAPYLARAYWVALERWDVLPAQELAGWLGKAHALSYAKLSKRTRAVLGLPAAERRRLIAERGKLVAASGRVRG